MHIYLVGGAVRDHLLGLEVIDRDYVVVGSSASAMLAAGYQSVGKDFPVFLHPKTKEEYALARTERKAGRGYHGFDFDTNAQVTLEDDLKRRDLTINAIAQDLNGALIDPYHGVRDLRAGVLRHVSEAFVEDPVRILRTARFAARFSKLGFQVADETMALMQRMVDSGEVNHLVAERVWQETHKALQEPTPSAFLKVLRQCGALRVLFPEIDKLYGIPQRAEFHPEIDTGLHVEMVVDQAAMLAPKNALVAYAALLHDLGKGTTPKDQLPAHIQHETRGVALTKVLSDRIKTPHAFAQAAAHASRFHLDCHRAFELKPQTILRLFESLDAFRKPEQLSTLLLVCEADKRGRLNHHDDDYPQARYLSEAFSLTQQINASPFIAQGLQGPAIGDAMHQSRINAISRLREIHQKS